MDGGEDGVMDCGHGMLDMAIHDTRIGDGDEHLGALGSKEDTEGAFGVLARTVNAVAGGLGHHILYNQNLHTEIVTSV